MILFHQVSVDRSEGGADIFYEVEPVGLRKRRLLFKIIEENATNSTRLLAMTDEKVIICPLFELRIIRRMMLVTNIFKFLMKESGIVFIDIVWHEIDASAKPCAAVTHLEVTGVHMNDRHKRIKWMNHDRDSGREK